MSKNSELKAKFRKKNRLNGKKKNFRKHMAELYDNKTLLQESHLEKALFIISG